MAEQGQCAQRHGILKPCDWLGEMKFEVQRQEQNCGDQDSFHGGPYIPIRQEHFRIIVMTQL